MVNQAAADRLWPGQDVLNRRIEENDISGGIATEFLYGCYEPIEERNNLGQLKQQYVLAPNSRQPSRDFRRRAGGGSG